MHTATNSDSSPRNRCSADWPNCSGYFWHLGMLLRSYPRPPVHNVLVGFCLGCDDKSRYFWLPGRYAALAWICRLLCWLAAVERRQEKGGLACAKCRLKSAPCAKFRRLKRSVRCGNFGSVSGVCRRAARGCRCRIASLAPCMTEWVFGSVGPPQLDRSAAPSE